MGCCTKDSCAFKVSHCATVVLMKEKIKLKLSVTPYHRHNCFYDLGTGCTVSMLLSSAQRAMSMQQRAGECASTQVRRFSFLKQSHKPQHTESKTVMTLYTRYCTPGLTHTAWLPRRCPPGVPWLTPPWVYTQRTEILRAF